MQSPVAPGWVRAQLPAVRAGHAGALRCRSSPTSTRVILPGVTHWQHPGWHAYFPTGASGPSVLADLVSSGLGVQGMLWSTSPACTELETLVLDWMAELLGLPERFRSGGAGGGVIEESASGATLCALLAARWRTAGDGPFDHLVRLHVDPGAQLDREGDADRRVAARPPPDGRRRRRVRAAAGRARRRDGRRPRRRTHAVLRRRQRRHHLVDRRSIRSGRSPMPVPRTGLAARRRRPCGVGARVPRAALDRRGRRASGQLLHEPPQVALHQLRLRLLLGGRPAGAHRCADRAARVPPQRGQRVGRGGRLPRLAGPARTAVPQPQALVRASRTTAPRGCTTTSESTSS